MSYRVDKMLYETRTRHQHLVLFEQKFFGRMLMLDGATQISTRDEFIYQEMMSHVPLLAHGRAREVLIVGGGDCGIAEEVLKHKAVKRLTQVEIDAVGRSNLPNSTFPEFTRPVFADKRFECVIDDGMKFVATTARRFDVIIVDSTDPQGPGKVLFSEKFYRGLQTLPEQRRRHGDAERRTDLSAARTRIERREIPPAVCRRCMLHRGGADLCRRASGDGLGDRQPAAPAFTGKDDRCALPQGRKFQDEVLDAGGPLRGFRPATFHRRRGRRREAATLTRGRRRRALRAAAPARTPRPIFWMGKTPHSSGREDAL